MPDHNPRSRDHPDNEQFRRDEEPLDTSPSSGPPGSGEKSYEESAPTSNDGRSKTRTTFYAEEGDNTKNWSHLSKVNDGLYSGDSDGESQRKHHAERQRDLEIFCERAKFTQQLRNNAFYILNKIDDTTQFHDDDSMLLGVIAVVAEQHYWFFRHDTQFHDIRHDCNVSIKQLQNAKSNIRDIV